MSHFFCESFWGKNECTRSAPGYVEGWDRTIKAPPEPEDWIHDREIAVPSFVPTTKPDRVCWIVAESLETLAGQ